MGWLGAGSGVYSGLFPAAEGRKKSVGMVAAKPFVVHPLLGGLFFGLACRLGDFGFGTALARLQVVREVLANAAEGLNRVVRSFGLSEGVIKKPWNFIE